MWGEIQHRQLSYQLSILQFLRAAILSSCDFGESLRRFQRVRGITVGGRARSSAADWKLEATTAFSGYWTESCTTPTQNLLWLLLAAQSPEEPINGKKGLARTWMQSPKGPPWVRALGWVSKEPLCWLHFQAANISWLVLLATSLVCDNDPAQTNAQLRIWAKLWGNGHIFTYELENKQSWLHQGAQCSPLRSVAEWTTLVWLPERSFWLQKKNGVSFYVQCQISSASKKNSHVMNREVMFYYLTGVTQLFKPYVHHICWLPCLWKDTWGGVFVYIGVVCVSSVLSWKRHGTDAESCSSWELGGAAQGSPRATWPCSL